MTPLYIERRGAVPHDGSRRVIAGGRVERDEAATTGIAAVARAGHKVRLPCKAAEEADGRTCASEGDRNG